MDKIWQCTVWNVKRKMGARWHLFVVAYRMVFYQLWTYNLWTFNQVTSFILNLYVALQKSIPTVSLSHKVALCSFSWNLLVLSTRIVYCTLIPFEIRNLNLQSKGVYLRLRYILSGTNCSLYKMVHPFRITLSRVTRSVLEFSPCLDRQSETDVRR